MAGSTRNEQLGKLQTALERNYSPVSLSDRPLLDQLLYAACLEDSSFDAADEGFSKLQEFFIDWNEIRVSTVTELSQVLGGLTDPIAAARRLKTALQTIFEQGVLEQNYTFDLEFLRKEKQSAVVEAISGLAGVTPFMVAFMVQQGLGGHMIPVDRAAVRLAQCLGLIKDSDAADPTPQIASLDRAVPKADGSEFFRRMHQAAVECYTAQLTPALKKLFKEIHPEGLDRVAILHAEALAAPPTPSKPPAPPAEAAADAKSAGKGKAKPAAPTGAAPVKPAAPPASRGKSAKKDSGSTDADPTDVKPASKKPGKAAPDEPTPAPDAPIKKRTRPTESSDSQAGDDAVPSRGPLIDGPTPRPSRKRLTPPEAETPAEPVAAEPSGDAAADKSAKTLRRKPR